MNKPAVDIRSLRYAVALAKYKNFHRAADSLGITQPALTRSIHNLESSLGVKLFERLHSGVEPTKYADMVVEFSTDIFLKLEELINRLQIMSSNQQGSLSIGVGHYFGRSSYSRKIHNFISGNSSEKINMMEGNSRQLLQLLRQGEIHLLIADLSRFFYHPDLFFQTFHESKPFIFCRSGHPIAKLKKVTFHEMKKYPLALFDMTESSNEFFYKLAPKGIVLEDYVQKAIKNTCNSYELLRQIILHSDKLTVGSDITFEEDVAAGLLARIELETCEPYISKSSIITMKDRSLPAAADQLIKDLMA